MSLPNTESQTAGFPLMIPTLSQQPSARLVVRNAHGQIVQQWLVKQSKCTLGSAASCGVRCELPGIAPYHALLVIGARQIFVRALAPKLSRNGRPFNEILLTQEEGHFEIASYRFELTRGRQSVTDASSASGQPDRLRFTLARPVVLRNRQAPPTTTVPDVTRLNSAANTAPLDAKWVAQLIQSAVGPLETQLHSLLNPISELTAESRKLRKQRRKRSLAQSRSVESTPLTMTALNESEITRQVGELALRHSTSMELLTERISDVNQQLTALERVIADERAASGEEIEATLQPQIVQQNVAIEQLQAGLTVISTTLDTFRQQQSTQTNSDQQWQLATQQQLAGLGEVVSSLFEVVGEVRQSVTQQASVHETDRSAEASADQSWKTEVHNQLSQLAQTTTGLSVALDGVRQDLKSQAAQLLASLTPELDSPWKVSIQGQLGQLTLTLDAVSREITQAQQATTERIARLESSVARGPDNAWQVRLEQQLSDICLSVENMADSLSTLQNVTTTSSAESRSQEDASLLWRTEVQQQLAGVSQTIVELSANVSDMRQLTGVQAAAIDALAQPRSQEDSSLPWRTQVQQQLGSLSQTMTELTQSVSEIHQLAGRQASVVDSLAEPRNVEDSSQPWRNAVQIQLDSLARAMAELTANVGEIHQIALRESTETEAATTGDEPSSVQAVWPGIAQRAAAAAVPLMGDASTDDFGLSSENWNSIASADGFSALTNDALSANSLASVESHQESLAPVFEAEEQRYEPPTHDLYEVIEESAQDFAAESGLNEPVSEPWESSPPEYPAEAPANHNLFDSWGQSQSDNQEDEEFMFGGQTLPAESLSAEALYPEALSPETLYAESPVSEFDGTEFDGSESPALELGADEPEADEPDADEPQTYEPQQSTYEAADWGANYSNTSEDQLSNELAGGAGTALPSWWIEDETPAAEPDLATSSAEASSQESELEQPAELDTAAAEVADFFGLAQFPSSQDSDFEQLQAGYRTEDSEPETSLDTFDKPRAQRADFDVDELAISHQANDHVDHFQDQHDDRSGARSEAPQADQLVELEVTDEVISSDEDLLRTEVAAHASLASEPAGEDDDSVEDYMRKLLARMRGSLEDEVELTKTETPAKQVRVEKSSLSAVATRTATESAALTASRATAETTANNSETIGSSERTTAFSPKTELDSLDVTEPFDPEKYTPRVVAPERMQSMAAFRELANSSARTAIHRSVRKRHVTSILLKFAIACVGLVVGMVLTAINGFNVNIGLIATVAAFLVAAIWSFDALSNLRPMLQSGLVLRPERTTTVPAKETEDA